jgi:hypothetical protein
MFADDHFELAPCETNSKPSCQRSRFFVRYKAKPNPSTISTFQRLNWEGVGSVSSQKENNPGHAGAAYLRATKVVEFGKSASRKSQICPKC